MNVGRVSRLSSLYYANTVTNIGPSGLSPSGSQPRSAPTTSAGVLSPEKDAGPPARGDLATIYKNSDGDSAEITNKAMDLWRNSATGKNTSPAQPFSNQNGTPTAFDRKLDLPSPIYVEDSLTFTFLM